MTFPSADPLPSGRPFEVLEVGGIAPSQIDQFAGDTAFRVNSGHESMDVHGVGVATGSGVRFHEKDLMHGKDVRVWSITGDAAAGFFAATDPTF